MLTLAIVYGLLLEFSLVRTHIYQNSCVVKRLWYCKQPGVSRRAEINLFFLYAVKSIYRIGNSCGLQFIFGIKHYWKPQSVSENFGCLVRIDFA